MFKICIEKPTGEEAIAELLRVADFYRGRPEIAGQNQGAAPQETKTRGRKEKQGNASSPAASGTPESAPAAQPQAQTLTGGGEAETQQGNVAPWQDSRHVPDTTSGSQTVEVDEKAIEAKRSELRKILTAASVAGRADDVTKLVQTYATALSKVPADKLDELLVKAKEL